MKLEAPTTRRKRGTVSVEIVIMLPVFVSLLAAVGYLFGVAFASQSASMAARGCAWAYALEACDGALPEVCRQLDLGKSDSLRIDVAGGVLEVGSGGVDFDGSWFDALASIPVLGKAVEGVFGVGKRIKATRKTPSYLQRGKDSLSASQYVVCNPKPGNWSAKVRDLFEQVMNCDDNGRNPLCN